MSGFVFAIPSYHRSDSIKVNTLKTLDDCSVPHELIKVFVSAAEVPAYRASLPADIEVVESVVGCIENRARIRSYFPEGQHIVYLDDDIKGIYSICDLTDEHTTCHIFNKKNLGQSTYKKQIPIPNFMKFCQNAFETLVKEGAHFGGIYPISNGFFCSHRYTTDLRYICGGFYFEINLKEVTLSGLQYGEDFERTCLFYKRDKKVVRFEYVILKTGYYTGAGDNGTAGGLVESRTVELSKQAQHRVAELYPDYVTVVPPTKNNKYWNMKLKRIK